MGNFDFVRQTLPSVHADCARAESYLSSDPRSACFYSRRAVEELVGTSTTSSRCPMPYRDDLAAQDQRRGVQGEGAAGHHAEADRDPQASATRPSTRTGRSAPTCRSQVLRELFNVVVWTSFHHSADPSVVPPQAQFDPALAAKAAPLSREEVARLAAKFKAQDEAHAKALAEKDERLAAHEAEIAELKARSRPPRQQPRSTPRLRRGRDPRPVHRRPAARGRLGAGSGARPRVRGHRHAERRGQGLRRLRAVGRRRAAAGGGRGQAHHEVAARSGSSRPSSTPTAWRSSSAAGR